MNIEIYPLKKVLIDHVAICFGMEKSSVDAVIGNGQRIGNRCYYFNHEMAIDYKNNKVEFIEFLGGIDGMLKPTIYGISAFEAQANELFDVLTKQNNGMVGDHENGYSYQFENISVGVSREAVPQEVEEMFGEAASFGNPMFDDEILDNEIYLGHTINCSTTVVSYKDKRKKDAMESEWYRFENTHEAIIDKVTFLFHSFPQKRKGRGKEGENHPSKMEIKTEGRGKKIRIHKAMKKKKTLSTKTVNKV